MLYLNKYFPATIIWRVAALCFRGTGDRKTVRAVARVVGGVVKQLDGVRVLETDRRPFWRAGFVRERHSVMRCESTYVCLVSVPWRGVRCDVDGPFQSPMVAPALSAILAAQADE